MDDSHNRPSRETGACLIGIMVSRIARQEIVLVLAPVLTGNSIVIIIRVAHMYRSCGMRWILRSRKVRLNYSVQAGNYPRSKPFENLHDVAPYHAEKMKR